MCMGQAVMNGFDQELLRILRTDMEGENRLRTDENARRQYIEEMKQMSGKPNAYNRAFHRVAVGRHVRYVDMPEHRTSLIEIYYMVSGQTNVHVCNKELVLKEGDFFIPNQYTTHSHSALNENDILVSFIVKPQFIEEVCTKRKEDSVLTGFLMDTLRKNIVWNQYLHFSQIEDLALRDIVEAILHVAFPYMNEEIMGTGVSDGSDLLEAMTGTMLSLLSRNINTAKTDAPKTQEETIKETVETYVRNDYNTASLQELSAMVNQSESSLSRQIKKIFGCTFKELLMKMRFERALVLLSQTNLPIADIALALGYENTSFFYRRFREIYGVSPKEYRKNNT